MTSFGIRHATLPDAGALAELHVTTFKETHGSFNAPGIALRKQQWQQILGDKNDDLFCLLVVDENKDAVGFAFCLPYHHEEHGEYKGQLNKIYLLQQYKKIGLGRLLLCHVAQKFIARGIHSILLFGDAGNASNGFYEHMGASRLHAPNGEFHGGYGWKDITALARQCATA